MNNNLRFFVVDDHMLMRKLLKQQLQALGYDKIETAINGKNALDKLEDKLTNGKNLYDIVFLDWGMPIMDGMELLKICRANKAFDKIAFVMLTGECEKKSVLMALQAGATSYIVKPISQNILSEKLENILKWVNKKQGE